MRSRVAIFERGIELKTRCVPSRRWSCYWRGRAVDVLRPVSFDDIYLCRSDTCLYPNVCRLILYSRRHDINARLLAELVDAERQDQAMSLSIGNRVERLCEIPTLTLFLIIRIFRRVHDDVLAWRENCFISSFVTFFNVWPQNNL